MSAKIDGIWEQAIVTGNQIACKLNIPDGAVARRIEIAEFNNAVYQFPAFTFWKLYVAMAKRSEVRAAELSGILESKAMSRRSVDKKKQYSLHTSNPDDMLEYFDSIIETYAFSNFALEAYINLRIDSFRPTTADEMFIQKLTKKINFTGLKENKANLVRECSLEKKLFYILPYFLKKKNINLHKINSFKSNFNLLVRVRNALVHFDRLKSRSGQKRDGKFKASKLLSSLIPRFNKERITLQFYPASFVVEIIEYIEEACTLK